MQHTVARGDTLSRIAARYQVTVSQLLAANPRFKPNPNQIRVNDLINIPGASPTVKKKSRSRKKTATSRGKPLVVEAGQLTFDAEGNDNENSRYFSRRPHVPSDSSGVTIGRGYDFKHRSVQEVIDDLCEAGVPRARASRLADGAGLSGDRAKAFIRNNDLKQETINRPQQKSLFVMTYAEIEADVLRICNKADVVAKYGKTKWQALDPRIRDLVVDLRYRGDYHPRSRQEVQPILVSGDVDALATLMADKAYWAQFGVPANRFKVRKQYLA